MDWEENLKFISFILEFISFYKFLVTVVRCLIQANPLLHRFIKLRGVDVNMSVYAVTRITAELYGLSSDTKPTANIPAGSTFLETDTTNVYVFDGTAWHQLGVN